MALSKDNPQQEDKTHLASGETTTDPRFLAVMQESADIFGILTPRGEMQEVSPSWQNFTGQEEHEYRGRGWLEAFHPADQPQIAENTAGRAQRDTAIGPTAPETDHHDAVCLPRVEDVRPGAHEGAGGFGVPD